MDGKRIYIVLLPTLPLKCPSCIHLLSQQRVRVIVVLISDSKPAPHSVNAVPLALPLLWLALTDTNRLFLHVGRLSTCRRRPPSPSSRRLSPPRSTSSRLMRPPFHQPIATILMPRPGLQSGRLTSLRPPKISCVLKMSKLKKIRRSVA